MTSAGSKIRAYQLDKLGSLHGLVLAERDMPSPGAGEVLVRVRASSLNFRDMMILNGLYPMPIPAGRVPLSDGAGEVIAVGAGVTRFKVGDRVINSFFPNFFGGSYNVMPEQWVVDHDGWLTEYKAVSAERTRTGQKDGVGTRPCRFDESDLIEPDDGTSLDCWAFSFCDQ